MVNYKELLFPYVKNRKDELIKNDKSFAHYTSAENALKILRNGELWLRKASLMNDTQELVLGKEILLDYLQRKEVKSRLSKILKGFSTQLKLNSILKNIDSDEFQTMKSSTYIASLTEMSNGKYNDLLSMWRGYGYNNGVALVFYRDEILRICNENSSLHLSPVLYARKDDNISPFKDALDSLEANSNKICSEFLPEFKNDFFEKYLTDNFTALLAQTYKNNVPAIINTIMQTIDEDIYQICESVKNQLNPQYSSIWDKSLPKIISEIKSYHDKKLTNVAIESIVKKIFYLSIVSIKHAGFEEEAEWRILFDEREHTSSDSVPTRVECIKNTPQKVAKLSLNLSLKEDQKNSCLHKIIIGPCANPEIIREAFIDELSEIGYTEPEKIIHISDIPLRT